MEHTPEERKQMNTVEGGNEAPVYRERPILHRIVSWILIAIVLFGFLGTCYWLAFYGV